MLPVPRGDTHRFDRGRESAEVWTEEAGWGLSPRGGWQQVANQKNVLSLKSAFGDGVGLQETPGLA